MDRYYGECWQYVQTNFNQEIGHISKQLKTALCSETNCFITALSKSLRRHLACFVRQGAITAEVLLSKHRDV